MERRRVQKTEKRIFRRTLAFLFDWILLLFVVVAPFQAILGALVPTDEPFEMLHFLDNVQVLNQVSLVIFFITLFALTYFVLMEYILGQTVGKMIFSLHVRSMHERLGFFQCIGRSLFIIPFFPFTLLYVVDLVFLVFFTKSGQRLSELLSKTCVVGDNHEKERR